MLIRTILAGAALSTALWGGVDFEKEIRPVIEKNCVGCHNEEMRMGSLRLDTREGAMAGGRTGQGVIPGEPERSRIFEMISGNKPRMPPTGALPGETVELIKKWIAEGAPWVEKAVAKKKWEVDGRMAGLRAAMRDGRFGVVRAAVEKEVDLVKARDGEGNTLLHLAAMYGDAGLLRWLLEKGADVKAVNGARVTALHLGTGDFGKAKALVEAGADVNAESADGRRVMMLAAGMGRSREVVGLLLDKGAKALPADLRLAVSACEAGSVELLLGALRSEKAADIYKQIGAWHDCPAVGTVLAKRGVGAAEMLSKTDLLSGGAIGAVRDAAARGDAGVKMNDGTTALMYAVYADPVDLGLIRQLIAAGADMNAKNKDGRTALGLARRKGAAEAEKLLLAAGAKE